STPAVSDPPSTDDWEEPVSDPPSTDDWEEPVIAINELSECNERGRPLLDESRAIFTHIDRAGRVVVRGGWTPSSRDTHV
ncbi:MAG: hypothetical protein ACLS8N_11565, partial [Cutibacterium avidum]